MRERRVIPDVLDEATLKAILDAEWEACGIVSLTDRLQPCPHRLVTASGVRYCDYSDVSEGRCQYNAGGEVLVSAEELPESISMEGRRTSLANDLAGFLNAVDTKNVCTYSLPGEDKPKQPLQS